MPSRTRLLDRGRAIGRRSVQEVCRDLDDARLDRGLSFAALGRELGISGQHVARVCRGTTMNVSLRRLAEIAGLVGLDLVVRTYPGGPPLRDAAHVALLGRLRARLPPTVTWQTEVPVISMAGSVDRRAWDATISADDWTIGIEAETRVSDLQALERRLSLKRRDSGLEVIVLLLNDTAHHQRLLRSVGSLPSFPISARAALRELSRGSPPSGSAIISL